MASSALIRHLKEQWEKACNAYLLELVNTWDLDTSYGFWIADDVGGTYAYGDVYFLSMEDIKYCVENNLTREEYVEYQEYNSDACSLGFDNINLRSWHNGCPRLTKEQIQHLYDLKKELNDETERLKEQLKNGKNNQF